MSKFNLDKAVTDIVKYQQIQIKGKGKNMNDVKEQELKKTIKHFMGRSIALIYCSSFFNICQSL